MNQSKLLISLLSFASFAAASPADPDAPDLSPVNHLPPPAHPPLVLASGGEAKAAILLHAQGTRDLAPMVEELREVFFEKTGAKLEVLTPEAAERYKGVLIHIGDSPLAEDQGLVGKKMPPEGFAIKTAPDAIFIVGHDEEAPKTGRHFRSSGTAWGVAEFMERFLGVRWYWPKELGGRSVEPASVLQMPPTHLTDAPHFRQRVYWPPSNELGKYGKPNLSRLLLSLRSGTSWPVQLAVHAPRNWGRNAVYQKERPEMFQLNRDGSRNFEMLDYAHPLTLQTYLEEIEDSVKNGTEKDFIIGNTVTVSPADFAVNSYGPEARALWDDAGGPYGQASKIMADFVNRLALAMKERFPQMNILYLPYLNYALAPEGYEFPGNVHVQLCGMPGLAQFKEPLIRKAEQANIDKWVRISGHPLIDWHYSCWPADRTSAPFQYPNVIQEYYQTNREKTVGTFINGLPEKDEWLRFPFTLHTWLKVLWNPDFPVEKSLDEFCRRMFGPAEKSARQILNLQIKSWEDSRWPDGRITARAVYEFSYPRETLEKFRRLFAKAKQEAGGDRLALQRLEYLEAPFEPFEKEFARVVDGKGLREISAQKVRENPEIDGKLDDAVWKDAEVITLRKNRGAGEEVEPEFPTEVSAVWTLAGITFGFRMTEPEVSALKAEAAGRDHPLTWHDDCGELFLDPGGKNSGEFFQIIGNSKGTILDARQGDETFDFAGIKTASYLGDDFWSWEIFIPFKDLGYAKSSSGGDRWGIQITRHRTAGGKKKTGPAENQKLNAGSGGPNHNLSDFSYLNFRE